MRSARKLVTSVGKLAVSGLVEDLIQTVVQYLNGVLNLTAADIEGRQEANGFSSTCQQT